MIKSSSWNSKKDESIYKAAGSLHLRKYGQFFESLAEKRWGNDSTLENYLEGPIRLVYKPVEDISLFSLVEMENKLLSKLLASVAGTCREIKLLKLEAENFYNKLFNHGEVSSENESKTIIVLLSDLQDLSVFVNRVMTVIHLTTRQISSLSGSCHEIYLPILIEHFFDLFVILVTLEEVIDSQPTILEQWKKYRIQVRSIMHDPNQFDIPETKINAFDKLLKDLQDQLLKRNIFAKSIDYIMEASKGPLMNEQFSSYLKNILSDFENKVENNINLNKNWIRANVGVVIITKLFGTCDKKLMKKILEINKKFYALTLIENIIWIPSKFLNEFLPKEAANVVNSQVGEKTLVSKTQKLSQIVNNLVYKAMNWCLEMQNIFCKNGLRVSDIGQKKNLLIELVSLLSQIKVNVSFITNLHAFLLKPMNKYTVFYICRLVELQKSLQTFFYILGPVIVQSQSQILQFISYHVLLILESARKGLIQREKSYKRDRLDALSLIGLSMRLINGPPTSDRRLIIRCALAYASQLTDTFKEEEIIKLRYLLENLDLIAELNENVDQICNYSLLLHHKNMIPAYFSLITDSNYNTVDHVTNFFSAFNSSIGNGNTEIMPDLKKKRIEELKEIFIKNVLKPASHEIETNLRLHVHFHLKLDSNNPFNVGAKDGGRIVRSPAIPLANHLIYCKRFIEHYLDDMFYNLTTVALHDWKTYRTMHALANYKLNLETVNNHLPTQTLEQGLDALEIMRNIHVFVAKYLYNLNTQTFIEHSSSNKHLNTIGIRHIANSIRTHGTGIMSTTVNFVYQFLKIKLHTFSQFLFDEHIKSRLMRDIRFIKSQRESDKVPYTYERAEKFQKGIRKLGMTRDGSSYLDQFRLLITQIGNALGYVRLIRSGGLHASSNAVSFLPDINCNVSFESYCKNLNYTKSTQNAAKRLEDDIANLVHNFTEGIQYFKLLVNVFSSAFRDSKSHHLQQFYAIVPPLTLSFVDNSVSNKEKMFKKNQTGAAFTDDGFAMGIAYINALLNQSAELDGLHWFKTVEDHLNMERLTAENKNDFGDEKLQQTRALTLKRLEERNAEFQLLYYSLSGARVFFKQTDS